MATVVRFQAKPSQFFVIFDSLVAITTHPGAQNSRSDSFGADNDAGQTDKPIALPRFAHARRVIIVKSIHIIMIVATLRTGPVDHLQQFIQQIKVDSAGTTLRQSTPRCSDSITDTTILKIADQQRAQWTLSILKLQQQTG